MKSVSDKAIRKAIKGKRKQKKIIFDTYKVDLIQFPKKQNYIV